jgi:hypothetical protein
MNQQQIFNKYHELSYAVKSLSGIVQNDWHRSPCTDNDFELFLRQHTEIILELNNLKSTVLEMKIRHQY